MVCLEGWHASMASLNMKDVKHHETFFVYWPQGLSYRGASLVILMTYYIVLIKKKGKHHHPQSLIKNVVEDCSLIDTDKKCS